MAGPQHSPRSRLRVPSHVNDNHCVNCVTGQTGLNPPPVVAKDKKVTKFECRPLCCKWSYCHRVATKERHKSQLLSNVHRNKICERCLCVGHLSSVNLVTNAPPVVTNPPVGARLHKCWEKCEALGSSPKVVTTLREGYTPPSGSDQT